MYDLISRQEAIDAIWSATPSDELVQGAVEEEIWNLPSVEPERKKGEWIYGEESGQDGWYCSECGFFVPWYYDFFGLDNIDFIADYHTCPKCDAKMLKYTGIRGEQNDKK